MPGKIHTAPPDTGTATLGKSLPDLLFEAATRYPGRKMLNQPGPDGWTPYTVEEFQTRAEEAALGFAALGLERGDHVALFMRSDAFFCIADMGCLLAGMVNVPVYLTHAPDAIQYVIDHADARAVIVSDEELLGQIAPLLQETPKVRWVILAEAGSGSATALPSGVELVTLDDVRQRGRRQRAAETGAVEALKTRIDPHDLATIIYTSGTTGQPKGVMLSHENITFNALTSFSGITGWRPGQEVCLSFLPLTHIFARTLHYGNVAYGSAVYFTTPDNLVHDFGQVRPTVFATVPRVLEKVYARIMERAATMKGIGQKLLLWALGLARAYELGNEPSGLARLKYAVADRLVFNKWRDALGGRVNWVISGGAALSGDLANLFAAAGVNVLQGYGLTETSPVITYNRPDRNRAGTVGEPIPGVEVKIAEDGEILTRGPHVMMGYFKAEEKTREVIDAEGWFHTGDIGEFTPDGYLRITDRKKDLFKLSTGKYVMPQPLENRLNTEPLVQHAVVVGNSRQFCTALIFPEMEALRSFAAARGIDTDGPADALLRKPRIVQLYQDLVDRANEGMDHWSTIKKFKLLSEEVSIENGLMTPSLKVKRARVNERFAEEIGSMY